MHSYAKYSEEDNGSVSKSLGAPLRKLCKVSVSFDYIRGQKVPLNILIHPILIKFKPSTSKPIVYSCLKFLERDNESGPESLGSPARERWGQSPLKNSDEI